jgi:hypothetical protein
VVFQTSRAIISRETTVPRFTMRYSSNSNSRPSVQAACPRESSCAPDVHGRQSCGMPQAVHNCRSVRNTESAVLNALKNQVESRPCPRIEFWRPTPNPARRVSCHRRHEGHLSTIPRRARANVTSSRIEVKYIMPQITSPATGFIHEHY